MGSTAPSTNEPATIVNLKRDAERKEALANFKVFLENALTCTNELLATDDQVERFDGFTELHAGMEIATTSFEKLIEPGGPEVERIA